MDTVTKSVEFTVTMDVNTASDVEIEYEETKKKFTGTYTTTSSKSKLHKIVFNIYFKP